MQKNSKLFIFSIVILTITFFYLKNVKPIMAKLGHDSMIHGSVYVTVNGAKVPLPGVVLFREDEDSPWGANWGVAAVTQKAVSDPKYGLGVGGFAYFWYRYMPMDGYWVSTEQSPWCGAEKTGDSTGNDCPTINVGESTTKATCSRTWRCGLSCGGGNPQRILAYFPPDYNKNFLPAGVNFKDGDMKGGGSWKIATNSKESDGKGVYPGSGSWTPNAANFGKVEYKEGEWAAIYKVSNDVYPVDLDIEWIPGQASSLSCTGLTKNVSVINSGSKVIFTCASSVSNATLSHYEYRIHTPAQSTDTTSADYWTIPTGWDNLTGATPEYTIPSNGDYKVQCRACATANLPSGSKCTTWGLSQ